MSTVDLYTTCDHKEVIILKLYKSLPMDYVRLVILVLTIIITSSSCSDSPVDPSEPQTEADGLYFPPIDSDVWESVDINSIGWNANARQELYSFLEASNTRAFIVLKDGKIVMEEYWGNNILDTAPFTAATNWYWASAGKTIISFLVGIAQQEGDLNIHDKSSDYLGQEWTSMSTELEENITVRDQLTMSTGLDYVVRDAHCIDAACLDYKAPPGTEWFYYNAPYLLLKDVITNATGIHHNTYTDQKLENVIGMSGEWLQSDLELYWSSARDMARFGLLMLNQGKWEDQELLTDMEYFTEMTNTSQDLNPSYGYLFWLNGKSSIIFPGLPTSFGRQLSPSAPADLFAAIGRNGQIIDIIPSENVVVVRMGESPDDSLVPVSFHDEMWEYLSRVLNRR